MPCPMPPHAMWKFLPPDIRPRLEQIVSTACIKGGVAVFFRADDVAAADSDLARLLFLFAGHRAPLCPALVPAWLSNESWHAIRSLVPDRGLFAWHQHGWEHVNHEPAGKKQEFGPSRPLAEKLTDLARGKTRLESIVGHTSLLPVLTPPWNRVDPQTLQALAHAGFRAVSRFYGAKPPAPRGLLDLDCHVDLHTRKEPEADSAWDALLAELEHGLSLGRCGIMIHHLRMNDYAFAFLDLLLSILSHYKGIELVHFGHFLQKGHHASDQDGLEGETLALQSALQPGAGE